MIKDPQNTIDKFLMKDIFTRHFGENIQKLPATQLDQLVMDMPHAK